LENYITFFANKKINKSLGALIDSLFFANFKKLKKRTICSKKASIKLLKLSSNCKKALRDFNVKLHHLRRESYFKHCFLLGGDLKKKKVIGSNSQKKKKEKNFFLIFSFHLLKNFFLILKNYLWLARDF